MEIFGLLFMALYLTIPLAWVVLCVCRRVRKWIFYPVLGILLAPPVLCTLSFVHFLLTTDQLTTAVLDHDRARVAQLLRWGADPNYHDGFYPILEAARDGDREMVRVLITHGARADVKDIWGDTPLKVVGGDKELIRLLRKAGAKE